MKFVITILLGIFLGVVTTHLVSAFNQEYIQVRIIDNGNCSAISYSVVMKNLKVTVSENQIESENTSVASNSEAMIYFLPKYNGEDKHRYQVKAEYSDCETIISEEREAERGRLIYEWIENRKFKHQIRA